MSDRELLELAAKAAGMEKGVEWVEGLYGQMMVLPRFKGTHGFRQPWNPLNDDGDALRLAVKLGILVGPKPWLEEVTTTWRGPFEVIREANGSDPYAATRRAIVRAAAQIGGKQ